MRRFAGIALAFGYLLAVAPTAPAATPPSGSLSDPAAQVRWTGSLTAAALTPPAPEVCLIAGCDEFTVTLASPAADIKPPGGVEISIRWTDELLDLDMYVYGPDGALAAKSAGLFASVGESVRLESPARGAYRVVVAPVYTETVSMDYEGLVEVEPGTAVAPVRELKPNLVALPPGNLSFATAQYLTDLKLPTNSLSSCYPEERVEQGAARCLRFDQIIANLGEGPFELRYRLDRMATEPDLLQRIYSSDGKIRERKADTYEFHPAHAHFHYKNFGVSRLWASDATGARIGAKPVRTGKKNGFCMIDVKDVWYGLKGDSPRTYYFPSCNLPNEGEGTEQSMINGISPGWADIYNWYLADQFIEVTGVPDGYYVLETLADPINTIEESDDTDNLASALLRLHGDAAEFVNPVAGPPSPARAKASRPRLHVQARALRLRAGRLAAVRVKVTALLNGRYGPVRGAVVRLGKARPRTGADGRAVLRVRVRRPGVYTLRATRRGLAPGIARLRVTR